MLVFLDIDGVMVPAQSWKSPPMLDDGFPAFSQMAIRVLQSIVSEDTNVILTTSHKSSFPIEQWVRIFEKRGISINSLSVLPEKGRMLSAGKTKFWIGLLLTMLMNPL
jgi:hypothetical protein